ncbi:MAG TPA: CAP domain-containing protein [Rhizobiaceae bacterium]
MTNDITRPCRPAAALALIALLATAGCQNVFSMVAPPGAGSIVDGVGASASAEEYLGAIRREYGLPPLAPDTTLEQAATQQAGYMARADKMAHRTGWGKDFASRMRANGVRGAAAENVAYGQQTPKDVFKAWMDSKGHRRNMLDPAFTRFGLASAEDERGRKYWALVLGR